MARVDDAMPTPMRVMLNTRHAPSLVNDIQQRQRDADDSDSDDDDTQDLMIRSYLLCRHGIYFCLRDSQSPYFAPYPNHDDATSSTTTTMSDDATVTITSSSTPTSNNDISLVSMGDLITSKYIIYCVVYYDETENVMILNVQHKGTKNDDMIIILH